MDDWGYITQNPWVTGADSPWRFWTTFAQTDYWPLTYTFYWLFFKIFGADPLGYHLVNLALHALNGALIFLVARRFDVRWPFWVALLFVVHPLHVQTVGWIVQSKTLLATFFALATVLAYQLYLTKEGRRWYAGALAAFACALLAKTSVVMLPLLLLGMAWNRPRREWIRLAPFFLLSLAGGLITIFVNDLNFQDREADVFHTGVAERLLVMTQNLIFYVKTFFYPVNLSYLYPLRVPEIYGPGLFLVPAGILTLALLAVVVWYKPWREYRFFVFAYLILLFPCLGLIAIPNMKLSLVADHWAYLPDVFMVIFLGRVLRVRDTTPWRAVLFVPVALFAVLTFRQSASFATEEAFWQRARVVNPMHAAPFYNLGTVYGKKNQTEDSIREYKLAIQRDLTHHRAWFNLGRAYFMTKDFEKAEECFLQATKLNPKLIIAYLALANTYQNIGSRDRALKALEKGLQENPGDHDLTARVNELRN